MNDGKTVCCHSVSEETESNYTNPFPFFHVQDGKKVKKIKTFSFFLSVIQEGLRICISEI